MSSHGVHPCERVLIYFHVRDMSLIWRTRAKGQSTARCVTSCGGCAVFSQLRLIQMDEEINNQIQREKTTASFHTAQHPVLNPRWPCVPREKNGKPLLTCTAHLLPYAHTRWHNTCYIVVKCSVSQICWMVVMRVHMQYIPLSKAFIFCSVK